jgi:hypothetical protein
MSKVGRDSWSFSQYIYELEYLAEYSKSGSVDKNIRILVREVVQKYPAESKAMGIVDRSE